MPTAGLEMIGWLRHGQRNVYRRLVLSSEMYEKFEIGRYELVAFGSKEGFFSKGSTLAYLS
jgi:hypothetical protein